MNTIHHAIEYTFEGKTRTCDVGVVRPPGESHRYWFNFKNRRPVNFYQEDGKWKTNGELKPGLEYALAAALEKYFGEK